MSISSSSSTSSISSNSNTSSINSSKTSSGISRKCLRLEVLLVLNFIEKKVKLPSSCNL
jgi:hypothetical protein